MVERLWIIGAFVTSMLSSALLTVLIFHFIRSRSRLALAFSGLVCGIMFHLISQIGLQHPAFRLFGPESVLGVTFFATVGSGLSVYGFANVATTILRQDHLSQFRIGFACLGSLTAAMTLAGFIFVRSPFLLWARQMEGVAAIAASLVVLLRRRNIPEDHVRLVGLIVSVILLTAGLLTVARLIAGSARGSVRPNWIQLTAMFLLETTVLIFTARWLVRTVRIHKEMLNPLAASEYDLSLREQDIIREISKGQSNEEIAAMLFISVSTVKNHIYHIYRKIGVHNRVEMLNAVMKKTD